MAHKFNGVDVRTPTSFNWDMEDILSGESGRSTNNGRSNVDIIAQKRKISYKWSDPSTEEVSSILQLINQKGIVNITYPDAMSGIYETRDFKTIKRGAPFRDLRVGARVFSELSLDFEEI